MSHALHVLLCLLGFMAVLENGIGAKTPPLIEDFLAMLAGNVGSVLAPNLSQELERRYKSRLNSTTTIAPLTTLKSVGEAQVRKSTVTSSSVTATTKKSKATSSPSTTRPTVVKPKPIEKIFGILEDSARAPQTQLENQFPFDFRNNYQNFLGIGQLQDGNRQFGGGLFGGRDSFNTDFNRPFNSFNGDRVVDNGGRGSDSRYPGRDSFFNGLNRPFSSLDSPQDNNFDRYPQNFGRLGFNGRFPNSNRLFSQGFRNDGSDQFSNFIGQRLDDRNNLLNNYRQDLRTNYQNSIANDQGQGFPAFIGSNYPQQLHAQNSFNFLPSQRFQNPFGDGLQNGQAQQRAPNYPPFLSSSGNDDEAPVAASLAALSNPNIEKNNAVTVGPRTLNTRRLGNSDKAINNNAKKSTTTEVPLKILQARDELVNILYPLLDEYSDLRSRPEIFKPSVIFSKVMGKAPKKNDG